MTRARCSDWLKLGTHRIMAGCGRVLIEGGEWVPPEEVQIAGRDGWYSTWCPDCGPACVQAQQDYTEAKADQVQWRAYTGKLKARLPEDPFEKMRG